MDSLQSKITRATDENAELHKKMEQEVQENIQLARDNKKQAKLVAKKEREQTNLQKMYTHTLLLLFLSFFGGPKKFWSCLRGFLGMVLPCQVQLPAHQV